MKKQLFFALAVAGALASCSSDELLNSVEQEKSQPKAIGFESFVDKSTRTSPINETTKSTISRILVWGGMTSNLSDPGYGDVFKGQKVTKSSATWTYSPLRYWVEGANNAYSFTAFGDAGTTDAITGLTYEHGTLTAGDDFMGKYHGKVKFSNKDASAGSDLVWASYKVQNITANMPVVPFSFKHLLSRVRLQFKNNFTSNDVKIQIKDVKINSASSAELDFSGKAYAASGLDISGWTWGNWPSGEGATFDRTYKFPKTSSGTTTYETASGAFNNAATNGAITEAWCLIPSQTSIDVYFNAGIILDDEPAGAWDHHYTLMLDAANLNAIFKPGYSYTLVATLDENNIANTPLNPILFTVEEIQEWKDWTDSSTGNTVVDYLYSVKFADDDTDATTIFFTKDMTVGGTALDLTKYIVTPNYDDIANFSDLNESDLKFIYSSSDETIATVGNDKSDATTFGKVTAVAAGTADISMEIQTKDGEKIGIARCQVTVAPASVALTAPAKFTAANATGTVSVGTVTPTVDLSGITPDWSSDDESVATVSGGTVTSVANGTTTITATYKKSVTYTDANNTTQTKDVVIARGTCVVEVAIP